VVGRVLGWDGLGWVGLGWVGLGGGWRGASRGHPMDGRGPGVRFFLGAAQLTAPPAARLHKICSCAPAAARPIRVRHCQLSPWGWRAARLRRRISHFRSRRRARAKNHPRFYLLLTPAFIRGTRAPVAPPPPNRPLPWRTRHGLSPSLQGPVSYKISLAHPFTLLIKVSSLIYDNAAPEEIFRWCSPRVRGSRRPRPPSRLRVCSCKLE
jgi:hypothetical protein